MLINLLIILFLLLMMAIWSHYGLFSAFLHLVVTVAAAALAIGLWEPLAYGALLKAVPAQAGWGVALLLPFALLLAGLQVATDRLVKANLDFNHLTNVIGGAFCGLLSGILTAGLTVIGVGFLPLDTSLAGYKPFIVDSGGNVKPNDGGLLWVPVDRMAGNFFERLSGGSFFSGTSMATHMPMLHEQHALYRMRLDENASVAALPDSIEVTQIAAGSAPFEGVEDEKIRELLEAKAKANPDTVQVIVVDTLVRHAVPPYDPVHKRLRLPPMQVRLLTHNPSASRLARAAMHAPIAYVLQNEKGEREFVPVDSLTTTVNTSMSNLTLGWVFVVADSLEASFLLVRHLRLPVPKVDGISSEASDRLVLKILGKTKAPEPEELADAQAEAQPQIRGRRGVKIRSKPKDIELTSQLPLDINLKRTSSLDYQGNKLLAGRRDDLSPSTFRPNKDDLIKAIYVPQDHSSVRVRLDQVRLNSLYGAARALAAELGGVFITDSNGEILNAIGYIWVKGRKQSIRIDRVNLIRSGSQLPRKQKVQPGHEIYLYFIVRKGVDIVSYNIGNTSWSLEPPLEVR